jgi:hypothetical protein
MSRKIDALIAEHVMGKPHDEIYYPHRFNAEGEKVIRRLIPQYSTDISAAWEVVGKMGHLGLNWEPLVIDKWDCVFERESTKADTAPMAICKAALKAKNVKF